MHETIEYIRAKCKENGGSVAKMERDCGFGNGYFNPKKLKRIPYEKAVIIAEYLNIPLNKVWKPEQKENPATNGDEVKIPASKYDLLNDANKAFIDEMIEKLIKSQSAG